MKCFSYKFAFLVPHEYYIFRIRIQTLTLYITMSTTTSGGKIRISLDLVPVARQRLENLQIKIEAASTIEVVRKALSFFDKAVDHKLAGGTLLFKAADGKETEVLLMF